MSRMAIFIACLCVLWSSVSHGAQQDYSRFGPINEKRGLFTKHFRDSRFATTENDRFSVEMLLPDGPLKVGRNRAEIIIHDRRDRDVKGAVIHVSAFTRQRGEDSLVQPAVSEKGEGLYAVDNLHIDTPGNWEIRVTVRAGDQEDTAVIDVPGIGN